MKEKELQRSRAVLPIGTIMKLTELTARQIRYYEAQSLILPVRSESNRRLYSLNDIDRLLEIKDYLTEGFNMAEIKRVYEKQASRRQQEHRKLTKPVSDADLLDALHNEFLTVGGLKHDGGAFSN
ncbi:Transcriptional regulator, repressor of the glutamine synthetase, MerR family [Pediococcus damnosus]|uniref:Transcriptional regulator, repressor of the glutamine synthetase, MerR family n=1 Tax=Pediococcus damnosus TaxID=51663 RepID=A0A0R2HDC6_9LACO|nr:MerR family transcriptional regulator [Pediococcus damnosus]AMV61391.1 Transcriptional regulator, repressor of the glutamine synthetase, MerR family [Pediococcus damnosus]AMV62252.1 Transcriptional regulator, repressor of the glutamine synthetase, MerR family [Pediococcus damnosus]AMV65751.1 Transcriptional regulator, repressor of the glutamine synthetase, MerR family [Pediococcus damnosus]AMV67889.1 Transcriptional regulator, repressor of the glutamine synthetase, MerR family [Pediococcus d